MSDRAAPTPRLPIRNAVTNSQATDVSKSKTKPRSPVLRKVYGH